MIALLLAAYALLALADYRDSRRLKLRRGASALNAVVWPYWFVVLTYSAAMCSMRRALR